MAKSDSHYYIGKNQTDLYTANNLYKYALKGFNNTNILKEQQGLTKLAIDGCIVVRSQLTESLLFGKAEACSGLSHLNKEGLGGVKSPYNQKLFLVIGSKLGNEACTKALATLQNTNDVEKEANIWVSFINKNKKHPDEEISSVNIAYTELTLKTMLTNNSVNLDAYNSHVDIIKLDEAETTHTSSVPNHQTTTTTTYPQYKNTADNDPNHIPVKPIGQTTQPAKEGCEIS